MRPAFFCLLVLAASPALVLGQPKAPARVLEWTFPLPRPHTGLLLGNGIQGLMVWGGHRELHLTIGRAGFWDRRGGNDFSSRTTFRQVKALLEANDEAGLRAVFGRENGGPQQGMHPRQIGGGRLSIAIPLPWELHTGILSLDKAEIQIVLANPSGKTATLRIRQAIFDELTYIELPARLANGMVARLTPSWEFVSEALQATGVQAPETWGDASGGGFLQTLPQDDPLALGWKREGARIWIATSVAPEAKAQTGALLQAASAERLANEADTWWKGYWADIPRLSLPDPDLQEIYDYGAYKMACTTPPHGLAATLQGPFMEDYQLPPWSNDYHFNINAQMIYWPALMTNRTSHFGPLWRMIQDWMPRMRATGEFFFQRSGALMMPHAVDDRCQVVGAFWTGSIDHGCAAWMAQMAWLHYRYTLDREVLETIAWPLLTGAFEGYWAMLEQVPDGRGGLRFTLPVSVSPEYRGAGMNAWGRDASFQLSALHLTAELLQQAAAAMGQPQDPRWAEVRARTPHYAAYTGLSNDDFGNSSTRIALWEGQDLVSSHRHHSHLAAIWPFVTIDPRDSAHQRIVDAAIQHWTLQGMGSWSGWCVPWAAVLNMRTGPVETAVARLRFWKENFVNEGRGTLHNANHTISVIGSPVWSKRPDGRYWEVMQLDAGFGAMQAVLELLVQHRRDGIHLLPDIPLGWESLSFDRIRIEGAFQLSARVRQGKTAEVVVNSLQGGPLRLHPYLGQNWTLNGAAHSGAVLEKTFEKGETAVLRRVE